MSNPTDKLHGKRVAVVVFSHYLSDARVRLDAEALAGLGMKVDVISFKGSTAESTRETVNGVNIYRLPSRNRGGGKAGYFLQYGGFLAAAFFILLFRSVTRRYDLVHVHNMPDILVFSAIMPKLLGAKVMLDMHDPMPELMSTIYELDENSRSVRLLKRMEKLSCGYADAVLTVNKACEDMFAKRSCDAEKIQVVMNSPDETIFQYQEVGNRCDDPRDPQAPFVIMYHGSLVERHGLDLAVSALQRIRASIPGAQLRVYGVRTPYLDEVLNSVEDASLREAIHYLGPKSLEQIAEAIGECDLGIIPNRRSVFTEINTPMRIFEYLSQAKPVIAPKVRGIRDYFGPEDLIFFRLGDVDDLTAKIEEVYRNPGKTQDIVKRGQAVYLRHQWKQERARFVSVVSELLLGKRSAKQNSGQGSEGACHQSVSSNPNEALSARRECR